MRNKLIDLNDLLFAELERLNDDDIMGDKESAELEMARASAIGKMAQTIINNAQVMLNAATVSDKLGVGVFRQDTSKLLTGDRSE